MADENQENKKGKDNDDPQNGNWTVEKYIDHLNKKTEKHNYFKTYSHGERITCIEKDKFLYLTDGRRWNDCVDRDEFCLNGEIKRYARSFCFSASESVAMWMLYAGTNDDGLMINIKPSLIKEIVEKCTEVEVGYFEGPVFHKEGTIHKPGFCLYLIDILYYGKKDPGQDKYDLKRSDTKYQLGDPEVIDQLKGYKKSYPWSYENECRMILELDENNDEVKKLLDNPKLKKSDVKKGEKALCPVCHEPINTRESIKNFVQFTCPSCSCTLTVDKHAETYVCPLCETEIDVQKRIRQQEAKSRGEASVVKYEGGSDVFVWKHPIEDFNLGSQLIVHESQEAIFFRDGKALDVFGAGRYTLANQSLPLLEKLYKLPQDADVAFHSEVYFVNLATQMGIKWGTDSKVRMFDPASGLHVDLGACGAFNLRVADSRKLVQRLVGTTDGFRRDDVMGGSEYGVQTAVGQFKALVMNKVKANLARAIREGGINVLEIDEHIDELSDRLKGIINTTLEEYGLTMPEFFITNVLTPDDDPNYKRLKQQFADRTLLVRQEQIKKEEAEAAQARKMVEAQTEAQLKMVGAQGDAEALKIMARAEADAYRAKAFAEADEMKAKGYTYQQETSRQVGLAAMQNGLTGDGGAASAMGEIAALGVSMGAMHSVVGMAKEALDPTLQQAAGAAQRATSADAWDCAVCGAKSITTKFCPECGAKRPESATWDCPNCGTTHIGSKFCPECGARKPEPASWTCPECGTQDISTKFCPNCGHKRSE